MKNAMDSEQSSSRVLEITPFIPLILRGGRREQSFFEDSPLKAYPRESGGKRVKESLKLPS